MEKSEDVEQRIDGLSKSLIDDFGAHVEGPDGHCMCGCEEVISEKIDLIIYFTGNLPNFSKLTDLSRSEWDKLVDQFINGPAISTQEALEHFVPGGL